MEKCLLTSTVLVQKLNLKFTRQIMVVIMIGYPLYILVSVEMCSLQIRNAVLCLFHTLHVHETCQCLVSSICFQSLRHKIQVYTFEYECRTTEAIFRASDIF